MAILLKYVKDDDHLRGTLSYIKKSKHKKVCYITLNKSCGLLKEKLRKAKLDSKDFYFIDAIITSIAWYNLGLTK